MTSNTGPKFATSVNILLIWLLEFTGNFFSYMRNHVKQCLKLRCLHFQIYMETIENSHRFLEVGQV